jgi:hypothetical protein
MQDRPTCDELLGAVEAFLNDIVTNDHGARRFQARVAANAIRMVRRELPREERALAREVAALRQLLGSTRGAGLAESQRSALRDEIARANATLCERIRRGDADAAPFRQEVLTHLRATVREKLQVSNPRWAGTAPEIH